MACIRVGAWGRWQRRRRAGQVGHPPSALTVHGL